MRKRIRQRHCNVEHPLVARLAVKHAGDFGNAGFHHRFQCRHVRHAGQRIAEGRTGVEPLLAILVDDDDIKRIGAQAALGAVVEGSQVTGFKLR
ncbi:hypothetical protein D3C87_1474930 [compost metagenome]